MLGWFLAKLAWYLLLYALLPAAVLLLTLQQSQCMRHLFSSWVFFPLVEPLFMFAFEGLRSEIMAELNDLVSHDPTLRRGDSVRVLEVGVGRARNLKHITRNIKYVAVDPDESMKANFLSLQSRYPHIQLEDWLLTTGETMSQVRDNTVDAVIVTHLLCSVPDARKVVIECSRVLAPGGKFVFLEHVAFPPDSWILQLQLLVDPLWQLLSCGCHLGRDVTNVIIEAGFREVALREVYLPILALLSRHVYGVATKGGAPPPPPLTPQVAAGPASESLPPPPPPPLPPRPAALPEASQAGTEAS